MSILAFTPIALTPACAERWATVFKGVHDSSSLISSKDPKLALKCCRKS